MAFTISDKQLNDRLSRNLEKARREEANSLEKLSSGSVFTLQDPRPSDRALAEGLELKIRSLGAAKRSINDAVSFLQTAESSMTEVSNMVVRMKELSLAAASTTVNDQERRFLVIEYQALFNEINRIADTTEFNGIPLLNGDRPESPEQLIFRVGDPYTVEEGGTSDPEDDLNAIRFEGFKSVNVTTDGLGLKTAFELLDDKEQEEGVTIEDIQDLMEPEDDQFRSAFDQAINTLSTQRAEFGAMQARLFRSADFIDVYEENLAAAKSHISDTDFAREVSHLVEQRILTSAATAILAQANIGSQLSLNLITSAVR